jgi:hypothetical protein
VQEKMVDSDAVPDIVERTDESGHMVARAELSFLFEEEDGIRRERFTEGCNVEERCGSVGRPVLTVRESVAALQCDRAFFGYEDCAAKAAVCICGKQTVELSSDSRVRNGTLAEERPN